MAKKNNKSPKFSQAELSALAKLKKKGLYKPKSAHKKPTSYAKRLLAKFSDVIGGKSTSIKTGRKVAREFANEAAGVGAPRSKGARVILPIGRGERAFFNAETGDVGTEFIGGGGRYIRSPFKGRAHSFEDIASQLDTNDRIAVPMFRGKNRAIEWREYTPDEFRAFFYKYGPNGTETDSEGKPRLFHGLTEFVERSRYEVVTPKHKETVKERKARFNEVTSRVISEQIARKRSRLI